MKSLLKFTTLIFCFSIEIHVRALDATYEAKGSRKIVELGEHKVVLRAGTLVQALSGERVRLIRGAVLIDGSANFMVQTPFAKFTCEDECTGLVERKKDHVYIKSLKGNWSLQRTGDKQVYQIPVAAMLRIGEVSVDGHSDLEFPQSLPWNSTVKEWASLFAGSAHDFKPVLAEFHQVWLEAVGQLTEIQTQAAGRALAADANERATRESQRQAKEREDAKLRQLFREKSYIYP
jgi:hypothetical protein